MKLLAIDGEMRDLVSEMSNQESSRIERSQRFGAARSRAMTMSLDGEIDKQEAAHVIEMLERLLLNGMVRVVVDLSEVSHFDYRAVRPLVKIADAFRKLGGDIRLAGLSPYLHAIFRSAGANDAFDYFGTVEEATWAVDRPSFVSQGG
jgi:anti-anti-sigma factor